MRAVIVDDERLARVELKRLLREHPEVDIVGESVNIVEAVARIDGLAPDVVFLDIEMPGGSGFDVLERLEHVPIVVFTTAHDAHAVRAFEVHALDYLLKPIDPRRLRDALERATARTEEPAASPPARTFLDRIFVRDGDFCGIAELTKIPLLESEGNYTRLHLAGNQPLLPRSLAYLEERLDPRVFFRANRQVLVNLGFVDRVEPDGTELTLRLSNGRTVTMSRRQALRFRQVLGT